MTRITLLFGICVCLLAAALPTQAQEPASPTVTVDSDGTLHWGPRLIPPSSAASPEARQAYVASMARNLPVAGLPPTQDGEQFKELAEDALKLYPVDVENSVIGGVPVTIYTAKDLAPRNRHRVAMEFEFDSEAIMLAALGKMRVISVHYSGPLATQSRQIAMVYQELLKTHNPTQIAMYGISGGCQLAANTTLWLASQNVPMPGALGLMTCAGGRFDGDTRHTNNGLDPELSDFTAFAKRRQSRLADNATPGDAPLEVLRQQIPSGFPPSYLLAGTRDMCLSEIVLLHRKLRHARIAADLNVFEGMWHAFSGQPRLPEARDAITDFADFLDKHLAT